MLLELFSQPFMQRAFLSGALLSALLACLGIFATLRKMAFFGDGIAHASLAGIAVALLAGISPLPVALVWAVLIALAIYRLERTTKLPSDTLIGILFTTSMALGVVLMSFTRGYQPDLVAYLFGNILAVKTADVITIACFAAVILTWVAASFRQLTYMSLAEENAVVSGVPVRMHTLALYVSLAIATVLAVKILGIILVSALLILPPAISRLVTSSFRGYVIWSFILAELMMFIGLTFSFFYDLPSGATVVLTGATLFFLAALMNKK
jgi:ABC-type Mn2+/Zn2+ transport system permease subunit